MHNFLFKYCAQKVDSMRLTVTQNTGLCAHPTTLQPRLVYANSSYTLFLPVSVPNLVHYFFTLITSVNGLFMPIIHRVNNNDNKLNLT